MFPQPQEGSLLQAEQAAGLTPHREGTTRLLGQDRDFARGTEGNLQARGQPKSALALCKPPQHAQDRGRAPSLDENHIYFTDTELHWWSILHTPGTRSSSRAPRAGPGHWGQNSHKFVSSEGPTDRQDGALHSRTPAAGQLPPQSRLETLNKYIQHLLGQAGTGWVRQGSVAHFYFRCLERKKRG